MIGMYLRSTGELVASVVRQRRLLWALAKRDVTDDYVHHSFAANWALVMPVFTMAVYLFVFTAVFPTRVQAPAGYATDAITYLFAGIVPWLTINQGIGRAMMSVINNSNIVKQMSFPLELLPLKTLVTPILFMLVTAAVAAAYGLWVTKGQIALAYALGLPAVLALTVVTLAGLALGLSAFQVFLRDVKEVVTMYLTLGLFLHPILYLPNAVPKVLEVVVYISPFSYLIFCWQDVLFYGGVERPWAWAIAAAIAAALLVLSARVFMASKAHFGEAL